jgi:hypothetical protein
MAFEAQFLCAFVLLPYTDVKRLSRAAGVSPAAFLYLGQIPSAPLRKAARLFAIFLQISNRSSPLQDSLSKGAPAAAGEDCPLCRVTPTKGDS